MLLVCLGSRPLRRREALQTGLWLASAIRTPACESRDFDEHSQGVAEKSLWLRAIRSWATYHSFFMCICGIGIGLHTRLLCHVQDTNGWHEKLRTEVM